MKKGRVHIENLKIRLPRQSSASPEGLAAEVGRELLRGIAATASDLNGTRKIGTLDAGRVRLRSAGGSLGERIARRGSDRLKEKFEG